MSEFMTQSQEALQSFLNTAVVIDDRIYEKASPTPQKIVTPVRRSGYTNGGYTNPSMSSVNNESSPSFNYIDHKSLTKAFLEKQILCTLVEPNSELMQSPDMLYKSIENAFAADIVILDWNLSDDEVLTKGLIKRRIEEKFSKSLQLICIYTSEDDLGRILAEIKELSCAEITIDYERENILKCKNTYFIVVNKKMNSERDLPSTLITEFSKVTSGLLSNTVLKSFAAIRDNTHTVISKFSQDMDSAFIAHRIFSNPSDDTMYHLNPLICDEISYILDDSDVHIDLSKKAILDFCQCYNFPHYEGTDKHLLKCKDDLQGMLENGSKKLSNMKDEKAVETAILGSDFTKIFGGTAYSDVKFSMLTTHINKYYSKPPVLQGGVILYNNKNYLLCIQPKCDSVRITKNKIRKFLFVPLTIIGKMSTTTSQNKISKNPFDIIVFDSGEYIYLSTSIKAFQLETINFMQSKDEDFIQAEKIEDTWFFSNEIENDSKNFIFIAQLKDMQIQRIIDKIAKNLSRIGLTESDWLRRCSSN